jgi:hypothetical protein
MGLDAKKMGPVRSVPDLGAMERRKEAEIGFLLANIEEMQKHLRLVTSELWSEVVAYLKGREIRAVNALLSENDDRKVACLQGEIRVYRLLMQQEEELRNAIAAYQAKLDSLRRPAGVSAT